MSKGSGGCAGVPAAGYTVYHVTFFFLNHESMIKIHISMDRLNPLSPQGWPEVGPGWLTDAPKPVPDLPTVLGTCWKFLIHSMFRWTKYCITHHPDPDPAGPLDRPGDRGGRTR